MKKKSYLQVSLRTFVFAAFPNGFFLTPGNCLREVYLGDAKHVNKHSWRLHTIGVALTTPLVDSKSHRAKNRIRKVHMELIGEHETYRPGSKLAGIEGARETYHFTGANTPNNNAAATTDVLLDDDVLVLKRERGGRLSHREKERLTELGGGVKVMTERGGWKGLDAEKPASGDEEVVVRKVKRRYRVRTRLASCFYSQCQISRYAECHINRTYSALVPAMMDGQAKETVIMDNGVLPVGVDEP